MNQIDEIPPELFFAELLLPLRHAVAQQGIHYLELGRVSESYWGPVITRTGGLEKLDKADCGGDAMLERLRQYWIARGDPFLPKLAPYLVELRRDIVEAEPAAAKPAPELSEFVYPLF